MTSTTTSIDRVEPIGRAEAASLSAEENRRVLDVLRALGDDDWSKPTECTAWDVRALAGHVLGGMEGFMTFREFVHQMRAGGKAAGDGPLIDGMTAVQVRERAALEPWQLIDRVAVAGPRAARARARVPALFRGLPLKQDVGGVTETWRMGYLLDVILTRDTWMHRVDLARATGGVPVLTADHDGRLVADVVADWARRHGRPFTLHLQGPAGGTFTGGSSESSEAGGSGGEPISLDAVEFCRILSGRATGAGLLTQEVPF